MPIGEICVRDVVICTRNTTIHQAAQQMRHHHVGDLVVVDESDGKRIPVGIITDRDIVLSVTALNLDPTVFLVGDLVVRPIVNVREDQGIFETIQCMRMNGVRRMPVLDREGSLAGIISTDDLIQLLADEMSELAKLISQEQTHETQLKQ
jgi:CBS domain-containing protein